MSRQLEQRQLHSDTAFSEGARVGRLGLSLNLNPYGPDDPLYSDWVRGWHSQVLDCARRAA
jgi:hypothetical protein